MNIEIIKDYNQKLLAVLGTVIVLMLIIGLISFTYIAIIEMTNYYDNNNQEEGILSADKIEKLQLENKRQQLISYDIPVLIDTLNLVYIIPVSHKTLNGAEYIGNATLGLMNTTGSVKSDKRYSSNQYGDYNNLLIYDSKKNNIKKLFDNRVNFGSLRTEYFDDDILILIEVSDKDTYKDGVINLEDLKFLCIYSLKDKDLRIIKIDNTDISKVSFVENSKDLFIKFGIDQNRDGKYSEYYEPSMIKKYNFKTRELTDIIDDEINNELQKKLEGTRQ